MTDADALAKLDELPVDGELAKISESLFNSRGDVAKLPNLGGRLKIIKILNDSQLFDIEGNKVDQVIGVIIEIQPTKTWFERDYDQSGGGERPLCFSNDGILPHSDSDQQQADNCAACPRNKFYDDPTPGREGKKKKDCRDTITMYLYSPKEDLPLLLRASTMNRKSVIEYVQALAERKLAKEMVITRFTLVKDNQTADIEFSGLRLEAADTIQALVKFFKETHGEQLSVRDIAKRIRDFKSIHAEAFNSSAGATAKSTTPAPRSTPKRSAPNESTPTGSASPEPEDSTKLNLDEPVADEEMAEPPF